MLVRVDSKQPVEKNFEVLRRAKLSDFGQKYSFLTTGVEQTVSHSEGFPPTGVLVLSADGNYGYIQVISSTKSDIIIKAGTSGINVTAWFV